MMNAPQRFTRLKAGALWIRIVFFSAALIWMTSFVAKSQKVFSPSTNIAVQQLEDSISDHDRRISSLESIRVDMRLTHIETLLEEHTQSDANTRNLIYAITGPLAVMFLGKIFVWFKELAQRAENE